MRICDQSLQRCQNNPGRQKKDKHILRLNFLHRADHKIRREALDVDCHTEQEEVYEVVDIAVRLAGLQASQQCHNDGTEVLLELGTDTQ